MADAVVGDDVLGDDPTVKQLESMVAEMCGKESGLFVPSGTMSNAVALKTHTDPGDEIITERYSHIYLYEGGGYAALCGSSIALPEGTNGLLTPDLVQNAIRKQKDLNPIIPMEASSVSKILRIVEVGHVTNKKYWMQSQRFRKPRTVQPTLTERVFSMPQLQPIPRFGV